MINLVFDHLSDSVLNDLKIHQIFHPQSAGNLIEYNDPENPKFSFSPAIRRFIFNNTSETINITRDFSASHYLYSIGVGHDPRQWCGGGFAGNFVPSVFDLLPERLIKDLKNKKALLLLDQSYEGYHEDFLWDWFHSECYRNKIPPESIIYVTGDLKSADSYDLYCKLNSISSRIQVIGDIFCDIILSSTLQSMPNNFSFYYDYKLENESSIKLFNCLNSNPRPHRLVNILNLKRNNLIEDGLISFKQADFNMISLDYRFKSFEKVVEKTKKILPMNCDDIGKDWTDDLGSMISRVRTNICKNSWVSLVTEASYFDYEGTFISEKIFKPIACFHPFILLGPRYSLEYLKQKGFQTFHPWIDEKYDTLSDHERFDKIIESIKKIQKLPNRLEWYKNLRNIVEHNYNKLREDVLKTKLESFTNYYKGYFNVS